MGYRILSFHEKNQLIIDLYYEFLEIKNPWNKAKENKAKLLSAIANLKIKSDALYSYIYHLKHAEDFQDNMTTVQDHLGYMFETNNRIQTIKYEYSRSVIKAIGSEESLYDDFLNSLTAMANHFTPIFIEDNLECGFRLPDYRLYDRSNDEYHEFPNLYFKVGINTLKENHFHLRLLEVDYCDEPNWDSGRNYYHPHINNGKICMGPEADEAVEFFLKKNDIYSIAVMMDSVLSVYNSNSPYLYLSDWISEYECNDCGCGLSSDNYCYCERNENYYCSECSHWSEYSGDHIPTDSAVWSEYHQDYFWNDDDRIGQCDDCGDAVKKDDLEKTVDGKYICPTCAENDYKWCIECERWALDYAVFKTFNEEYVCQKCADDDYQECKECGVYAAYIDSVETIENYYLCADCADKNYIECNECDLWMRNEDATRTAGGFDVCPKCLKNYKQCEECDAWIDRDANEDPLCDDCAAAIELEELEAQEN